MHASQLSCRLPSVCFATLLTAGLVGCAATMCCLTTKVAGLSDSTGFTQVLVVIGMSGAAASLRCYHRLQSEFRRSERGGGLLASHVASVRLAARGRSVSPSQEPQLERLRRDLAGDAAWTAFVAAKLPSGGIIGTMIGVLSVTDGFGRTIASLQDGEGKVALVGMADAMAGLSTAFTSSLVALSLAGWLAALLLCLRAIGEELLRKIAAHTEEQVLPELRLSEAEIAVQVAAPINELVAIGRQSYSLLLKVIEGTASMDAALRSLANSRNTLSLTPEASQSVREACRAVTDATRKQDDMARLLEALHERLAAPSSARHFKEDIHPSTTASASPLG